MVVEATEGDPEGHVECALEEDGRDEDCRCLVVSSAAQKQ